MTSIARLRDLLLDEDPQAVLGCTYGFEPEFFEQEILPAALPSLALDRGAGNTAAYLFAGDDALRKCPTLILCDHAERGKELAYDLVVLRPGSHAFHPKLLLLDYGQRLRVVVTSANLTRSGWTGALELFIFQDLEPGKPHAWATPLISFLEGVGATLPATTAEQLTPFVDRLTEVGSRKPAKGEPQLVSTLEKSLLDSVFSEVTAATKIHVVTPFMEGESGKGVFDRVEREYPGIEGTLYVRAEGPDAAPVIRGPEEKLRTLIRSGRWTIKRVRREWEGDAEDSPPRQLHGKLLALRQGRRVIAMVGSANVTAAALLGVPPRANVELCVLLNLTPRELSAILPQSDAVDIDEIQIEAPEAEPDPTSSVVDFVTEALYHSVTGTLELRLERGAPPLTVTYEDEVIAKAAKPPSWSGSLRLGRELEIGVISGDDEGRVPFLILDPAFLPPRGRAGKPGLDELLEIMAGAREPIDDGDSGSDGADGDPRPGVPGSPELLQDGGAFAWRKLMRGLSGLRRDLVASSRMEVEVKRLLDGPLGARALLDVLQDLRSDPGFLTADFAFALHQLRVTISSARAGIASSQTHETPAGLAEVDRWEKRLSADFEDLRRESKGDLRVQLDVLQAERSRK